MAFYRMGGGEEPTGNASEEHVLASKTFSNDLGTGKTGTMPDNTSTFKDVELSPDRNTVVIPQGYHPGNKTVFFTTNEVTGLTADRTKSSTYTYKDFDVRGMKPISKITIDPIRLSGVPYTPNTRSSSINMYSNNGATSSPITDSRECYRYVDTTKVPNTHNVGSIYTYPSKSNGDTVTFADNHTYGGVNASYVYANGWDLGQKNGFNSANNGQIMVQKHYYNQPVSTDPKVVDGGRLTDRTFTCYWTGSMMVVQLKYDRNVEMQPVKISPQNAAAREAGPMGLDVQTGEVSFSPIRFRLHNNGTDTNRGQCWISWVNNIKNGAEFTLYPRGAETTCADLITVYAIYA